MEVSDTYDPYLIISNFKQQRYVLRKWVAHIMFYSTFVANTAPSPLRF